MGIKTNKEFPPLGPYEIKTYLSQKGYDFNENGDDHFKLKVCPLCGHEYSFSINHVSGQFKCHYTACGKTGNYVSLRKMLGDPVEFERPLRKQLTFNQSIVDFFKIETRVPVTSNENPKVLEYLHARGFKNETLDDWRVSLRGHNAVNFPMCAIVEGRWQIVNGRVVTIDKKNSWSITGGPTGFAMGNHLIDWSLGGPIYVTEGQWDAMTAYQLGFRNVISLPNGAGNVYYDLLHYFPHDWPICIIVDMDESGHKCADKFVEIFGAERLSRIHLPTKDLNDWLQENPNLTKEDVLAKKSSSVKPRESIYRKIRRNISESEKVKPLVSTPFKSLDNLMAGGFFPAQMTSILAGSGAGKTTLVNQIAVHVANQAVKVGVISLEGSAEELDEKIDATITGTVGKDGDDKTILDNLLVSALKGKATTHGDIIGAVNTMATEDACKVIIVDNLDFITSGIDQKKYETTASLMSLADKYKFHLIQIWQPRKSDPTKDITSGDQKGESRVLQDSDNYIILNWRHPDGKKLQVEKNRKKGRGKYPIHLDYDRETNMYIEVPINSTFSGKNHSLSLV